MKNLMPIVLLHLFTSTSIQAQSKNVLENEQIRFQRMVAKDTSGLSMMLGDDLLYIHSNGHKETKAEHLKAVGSGTITYLEMEPVGQPALRKFHKTAYTFGELNVRGIVNGNPFDIVLHYSALYKKQRGRWILLNWQSTKIK